MLSEYMFYNKKKNTRRSVLFLLRELNAVSWGDLQQILLKSNEKYKCHIPKRLQNVKNIIILRIIRLHFVDVSARTEESDVSVHGAETNEIIIAIWMMGDQKCK